MSSDTKDQEFIYLYQSTRIRELSVALIMLAGVVLLRADAFLHLFSHALGGTSSDSGLYHWLLTQFPSSSGWFNTKAFYPYSQTLAWSDNYIFPTLLAQPLLSLGMPTIFVHNIFLLAATWLNGFCCYKLSYLLSGRYYPSIVSGFAFLSLAFFTTNLGHPQLQFAFWLPLGIFFFWKALASRRHFPAFLFGFTFFCCYLTTVYYSIFLVLCSIILLACLTLVRPDERWISRLLPVIVWGAIWSTLLLPFVFPYFNIQGVFGKREIYEAYYFAAHLGSFLTAPPLSFVYGFTSSLSHAEAQYFSGFLIYLFALLAALRLSQAKVLKVKFFTFFALLGSALACSLYARSYPVCGYLSALFSWSALVVFILLLRELGQIEKKLGFSIVTDRAIIASLAGLVVVCTLISLGPLGNPEKHQWALGVFRLPYELLPGIAAIRAVGRLGVVILLALCLLIPFGLHFIATLFKKEIPAWIFLVVSLFITLENYCTTYPLEPSRDVPLIFSILDNLADDSSTKTTLVLPLASNLRPDGQVKSWGEFARLNVNYMNWAANKNIELVNGYSGVKSKIAKEFPRKFSTFPDRRSLNALSMLAGVQYIIVMPEFYSAFYAPVFEKALARFSELTLLAKDDEGNYLLSFAPKQRVHENFTLRVPSYPESQLHLQVLPTYRPEEPLISIDIHELDHFGGELISVLPLRASGKWTTQSFTLPRPKNKARPFRLQFDIPEGNSLLIGPAEVTENDL